MTASVIGDAKEILARINDCLEQQDHSEWLAHIAELKDLSVNEIEDIVLPNDDAIVAGIFTDVKDKIEQEIERRKKERELPPEEIKVEDPDAEERIALETANAENEEKVAAASDMPELSNEAKEAEDEYIKFMMGDNGAKE